MISNKRYLAFYGKNYESMGGMDDFIGSADTVEECKQLIEKHNAGPIRIRYQWAHIWDTQEGKKVWEKY